MPVAMNLLISICIMLAIVAKAGPLLVMCMAIHIIMYMVILGCS